MTTDPNRKLKVFLCHSSHDKPAVREIYTRLQAEGWIDPWLDEEKLFPGQDWDLEIEKAVEETDAVLVLISKESVEKESYVQYELRNILHIAKYKPQGVVFVLPVRLDECETPRSLRMWQHVDYFPEERKDWAYDRLLVSLKMRAKKLGIDFAAILKEKTEKQKEELAEKKRKELAEKERKEKAAREATKKAEQERIAKEKREAEEKARLEKEAEEERERKTSAEKSRQEKISRENREDEERRLKKEREARFNAAFDDFDVSKAWEASMNKAKQETRQKNKRVVEKKKEIIVQPSPAREQIELENIKEVRFSEKNKKVDANELSTSSYKTTNLPFFVVGGILLFVFFIYQVSKNAATADVPVFDTSPISTEVLSTATTVPTRVPSPIPTPFISLEISSENANRISLVKDGVWKSVYDWDIDDSHSISYSENGVFLIINYVSRKDEYATKEIAFYDGRTLTERFSFSAIKDCSTMYVSPDEKYAVMGPSSVAYTFFQFGERCNEKNDIKTYKLGSLDKTETGSIPAEGDKAVLGFSNDNETFLYWADNRIYWYDILEDQVVQQTPVLSNLIAEGLLNTFLFNLSPNKTEIVIKNQSTQKNEVYSTSSMELRYSIEDSSCGLPKFTPDGGLLYSEGGTNHVGDVLCFWNANDGRFLYKIDAFSTQSILSARGDVLADYGSESIYLWNLKDGSLLHEFSIKGLVWDITFSPNGEILAVWANDVSLWDVSTGKRIIQLDNETNAYRAKLAFSPDGKTLLLVDQNDFEMWEVRP